MKRISILFIGILILSSAGPSHASNTSYGKIRGYSSGQNQRIHNKIAIDLVNGRSQRVSVDDMVRLIKVYNIVQFNSKASSAAQDMIIREIAYRMIKQHYLPRIGDQIKVYGQNVQAGLQQNNTYSYQPSMVLPINSANIKNNKQIDTLYWADAATQACAAIERLWVNRINNLNSQNRNNPENSKLFQALQSLKSKYDSVYPALDQDISADSNILIQAVENLIREWFLKGMILQEDFAVLAYLLNQYILLSSHLETSELEAEIKDFSSIDKLHHAILARIELVMDNIKDKDPSDYSALAMLQSLLDDISGKISTLSASTGNNHSNIRPRMIRP
jgi:hypothetical protein